MTMSAPSSRSVSTSRSASSTFAGSIWWLRRSPNCGVESAASRNGPWQAEQQHAEHAVRFRRRRFLHGLVHRQLIDAGHRADLTPDAASLADEERQDEAVGRQPRFAYEAANRLGAAQAARAARQREASGGRLCSHARDSATKTNENARNHGGYTRAAFARSCRISRFPRDREEDRHES